MADKSSLVSARPLRIAIMTDEIGWHSARLQKALRARGCSGRCVDLADCRIDTGWAWHGLVIPGFGRDLPDAVLVRGIAGSTFEQVTVRLGILHALRELGVPVYNDARAIERSVDKSMTSLLLHLAGIPTPHASTSESAAHARRVVMGAAAGNQRLVLKPLFGSQGNGLRQVGQIDGEFVELPPLVEYGQLAYLQQYVESATRPGFDWRVLVVGGRAVAAMRRVSKNWVRNVAQGAHCEPEPITGSSMLEIADIAVQATAALDLDYAGVDLVPRDSAGTVVSAAQVIEVNGVAAWRGLQTVTSFDIAACLVDDLLTRKLAAGGRCGRVAC